MARTDNLTNYLTDVATAIKTKKGDNTPILASNFDTEIANLPSGGGVVKENDVNFYDYEGTLLHSYTKAEFLALEAMPELPTRDGLTAMEWNWDLLTAKTYLATYDFLDIGVVYEPTDGKTKIYVTITEYTLNPAIYIRINGTCLVDWGDGTTSTITGTSTSSNYIATHTYQSSGDYVISLDSRDTQIWNVPGSSTNGSKLFCNSSNPDSTQNYRYVSCIKKLILGNNFLIKNDYFCYRCYNLEEVVLPNRTTGLAQYTFRDCQALKHITIPKKADYSIARNSFSNCYHLNSVSLSSSVKTISQYVFGYTYSLNRVAIPNDVTTLAVNCFNTSSVSKVNIPTSMTTLNQGLFNNCLRLKEIIIPDAIETIGNTVFYNCNILEKIKFSKNITSIGTGALSYLYNCELFDFSSAEQVPTLASNIDYMSSTAVIVVPDDLYSDWIVASYWSNYSSQIVKVSEY